MRGRSAKDVPKDHLSLVVTIIPLLIMVGLGLVILYYAHR